MRHKSQIQCVGRGSGYTWTDGVWWVSAEVSGSEVHAEGTEPTEADARACVEWHLRRWGVIP